MSANLNLSIPTPCHEKWENFQPTGQGGFCSSCSKVVVDFTKMTDTEIVHFLAHQSGSTCGRFKQSQLKSYQPIPPIQVKPGFRLIRSALASLVLATVGLTVQAQGMGVQPTTEQKSSGKNQLLSASSPQVYTGVVISSDDELPMPGVNVHLKGSTEFALTDAEGRFQFPTALKEGDVLIFSFIGYITQEVSVAPGISKNLLVRLSSDLTALGELVVMGAVQVDERYHVEAKPTWRTRISEWLSKK